VELPDASPNLEDAGAIDVPNGEEVDDRACGPTQPTPAVSAGHPPSETGAERLVVTLGFATFTHALSMRLDKRHIQEFS